MKKRMIKKNLKKNREKKRKKTRDVEGEVLISTDAELQIQELPRSKRTQIPVDAKVVEENEGWEYYLSPDGKSVYLQTTDYHPDPIRLTIKNLHDFIALIKAG